VSVRLTLTWPEDPSASIDVAALDSLRGGERVVSMIRSLAPETEEQRSLQTRASNMGETLLAERWALSGTFGSSVLEPFLVAVVLWLAITFTSFGLFAPTNTTVIAALGVSALSVAGAVFLVLEMDGPFDGLITVSPEPWRYLQAWLRQ
jgi:hypothetical protein